MEYVEGINKNINALKKYLLGEINYEEYLKMSNESKQSYNIEFETYKFEDFSKKMLSFFDDKELVKNRLEHEMHHYNICKKYKLKPKLMLKSYLRDGKKRYRPSVSEDEKEDKKRKWSKEKLWGYNYDQVNTNGASDNDKLLKEMLLEIKEKVFKKK